MNDLVVYMSSVTPESIRALYGAGFLLTMASYMTGLIVGIGKSAIRRL